MVQTLFISACSAFFFTKRNEQCRGNSGISEHIVELLERIQDNLFQRALDLRQTNTRTAASYEEFKEIIVDEGGFIYAHWDGSKEIEAKIKQETKATIRCLPLEDRSETGKCMVTGKPSEQEALFAIAY